MEGLLELTQTLGKEECLHFLNWHVEHIGHFATGQIFSEHVANGTACNKPKWCFGCALFDLLNAGTIALPVAFPISF